MNIPIFDITNIPKKRLHIIQNIVNNHKQDIIANRHITLQIQHLFEQSGLRYYGNYEKIYFVDSECEYIKIDFIYSQFYEDDYVFKKYDKRTYLVIQKGTPMQLFIPETQYTFLCEYQNLILTYKNTIELNNDIIKLHNKVMKFSLYYNKDSMYSNELIAMINENKLLHFIYWGFKDNFVLDFVNELVSIMYYLMHNTYILSNKKVFAYYDGRMHNNLFYGYEYK